jgi:hypothetical protein
MDEVRLRFEACTESPWPALIHWGVIHTTDLGSRQKFAATLLWSVSISVATRWRTIALTRDAKLAFGSWKRSAMQRYISRQISASYGLFCFA